MTDRIDRLPSPLRMAARAWRIRRLARPCGRPECGHPYDGHRHYSGSEHCACCPCGQFRGRRRWAR